MNAHTRHNKNSTSATAQSRVTIVVLEEFFPEPLMDRLPEVHEAFMGKTENASGSTITSEITELTTYAKEDHVRRQMWILVQNGLAAAFKRGNRWIWCRREKAEHMLKYRPYLKVDYEDLSKRTKHVKLPDGTQVEMDDYDQPI